MHIATWFGHHEIAKLLMAKGASIDVTDGLGRTPLHIAAWFKNLPSLRMFIEKNPSLINVQDRAGNTPLHLACQNNHKDEVSALLNAGANTKIKNAIGQTVLSIAETDDKPEILELLQQKEGENTKQGLIVDKAMMHEIRSMNKTLDELVNSQDKHAQDIRSLRETLDIQGQTLQMINSKQNEMKKLVGDLHIIASQIGQVIEELQPKKSRFRMSHVPK